MKSVGVFALSGVLSIGAFASEVEECIPPPGWNVNAEWFMFAPSFAFKAVEGACRYRFKTIDDYHVVREFEAKTPGSSLEPVWDKLPAGFVTVICLAEDSKGATIGLAGERTFWKNEKFKDGSYPKAKRSYADSIRMGMEYLLDRKANRYFLEHGKPDPGYDLNCYPAKMHSATIQAMCVYMKAGLSRNDEARKLAELSAEYLVSISQPEGSPLAAWPHTYEGENHTAKAYGGQQMTIYPAQAGSAFLALHSAIGNGKWLDAAKKIGETYLRLQGEDGTWFLKLYEKDGSPVNPNRLTPNAVISFLEDLHAATGDVRFRESANRAFGFIERGPLTTWNWEGQFEDVRPSKPYQNLTKHSACDTAIYLFSRYPNDARRLAQAKALLRFAEDQFIAWKTPARKDGVGFRNRPGFKSDKGTGWQAQYSIWKCPAVMEQYEWYLPIDASAAKLIRTFLAAYKATGDAECLAKARTLADAIVNNQRDDGSVPTGWFYPTTYHDWINCHIFSIKALQEMEDVLK